MQTSAFKESSPIQKLSLDVLREIFLSALDSVPFMNGWLSKLPWNETAYFPRLFSLVCSKWYTTIVGFPRVWATLVINDNTRPRLLDMCLRRSGAVPLELYFATGNANIYSFVKDLITPYLSRCVVITNLHDAVPKEFLSAIWANHHGLSSLKRLGVMSRAGTGNPDGWALKSVLQLHGLTRLDIDTYELNLHKDLLPNITELHLRVDATSSYAIFVLNTLRRFPNLRDLAIYGEMMYNLPPNETISPYPFPHLTTLYAFGSPSFPIFMHLMSAPHLYSVTIMHLAPISLCYKRSHLYPIQYRDLKPPPFERLALSIKDPPRYQLPPDDWTNELFSTFPNVKDVTLLGFSYVMTFIGAVSIGPFDAKWPNLIAVGVEPMVAAHGITEALCYMIQERALGGYPLKELRIDHMQKADKFIVENGYSWVKRGMIFSESRVRRGADEKSLYWVTHL